MTVAQTTRIGAEVLQSPDTNAQTTRISAEVLQSPDANAQSTRLSIEVLSATYTPDHAIFASMNM